MRWQKHFRASNTSGSEGKICYPTRVACLLHHHHSSIFNRHINETLCRGLLLAIGIVVLFQVQLLANSMHTLCDEGLKNLATWVFHLAQKAEESLAQENALLPESPLIHLLGLSFNVMCTAWRVGNIKSQGPKKIWNNYLLQISQKKPKGKGNISIIRKSFPHL